MASSSAVAESNSNGGDDLLTGDLGKNDYDWLLTPPGSPPAQIYHYNSSENAENFLSDPTALPNLVRSLATIKTSRQQVVGSKPDLITSKIKDSALFSQRNNGWNTAARSISNGANFSTINSKKPSSSSAAASSSSASASGTRPSSRSSTPIKRNPNPNTVILPSRPTTPTGRSSSKQPPSATIISSRSTTPTMRTRTMDSSLVRTTNGNSSSISGSFSMSTASSRSSTPSKRTSTPQSTVQMIRSSSVSKGRPLPSRSSPSSRSTSPNSKVPAQNSTATWQQLSAIPGFALEPPPNLRTTAAARSSSNMRSSYSSPIENHPIHIAATSRVSEGHDHYITPRRASDGHDMIMARRSTDGHDLISRRTSDGHELTSQRTSDSHDLTSRRTSDGPDPISRRASASPGRIRSISTVPPGSTLLDRPSSGSSALFTSRASSLKIERSPNATSKTVDKMIQSRRPIASTSSFNYSETMLRAGSMSQMKASSGGGKPASPTASSRDAAGFMRSSPRKPIDFTWNKDIRQSASNGLHSLVSNVPASSLYSIRPHYPGTRAVASQPNYVTSTKLDGPTTHDTSLEHYGMINNKNIAHDLELSSDLGEEFIVGEFGSVSSKLSASPASQGDSFSSLVKDSRVNNWLGSPEMYRDETPEVNIEKTAHNKTEMAAHNEPEMVTDAIEAPPIVCRHGSVASSCDLCKVKLRLQRLNEKCKASLAASFQASNDYSWKSSLSNGTLSARQN